MKREGQLQHPFLVDAPLAQYRAEHVPGHGADGAEEQDQAEPHDRRVLAAEQEGQLEGEEADGGADHGHPGRGQNHSRRPQLLALFGTGRGGGHDHPPQPGGEAQRQQVEEEGEAQGDADVDELEQHGGEHDHDTGDAGQQPELRVGLHQLRVVGDDGGYQRALGDGVGLGQHEEHERQREQPQAVEIHDEEHGDDGAAEAGEDHHQPPPTPHAVERGTEDRGHYGERRHGQQQIERHLPPGGLGADVEEERAGERDGNGGVAGGRRGVGPGQPGERRHDEPAGELPRHGRSPIRWDRVPRGGRRHAVIVRGLRPSYGASGPSNGAHGRQMGLTPAGPRSGSPGRGW